MRKTGRGDKSEAYSATFEAVGLATITGLRSMAGPALLSRAIRRGEVRGLKDTSFAALGSSKVSTSLQLLMVGEMIADKTPFVPARTSYFALTGRALSGALVGAALFTAKGRHPVPGAVLGALSAIPAAYAGEKLRVRATEKLGTMAGLILGLLEDGVVLSLGTNLLRRGRA